MNFGENINKFDNSYHKFEDDDADYIDPPIDQESLIPRPPEIIHVNLKTEELKRAMEIKEAMNDVMAQMEIDELERYHERMMNFSKSLLERFGREYLLNIMLYHVLVSSTPKQNKVKYFDVNEIEYSIAEFLDRELGIKN